MNCESCLKANGARYEHSLFGPAGAPRETSQLILCAACARARRKALPPQPGIARADWIAELDRFFDESGAANICRLCHQQGTGCCPTSCRRLGDHGCRSKIVWCGAFICAALLLAIEECDPETARLLRWARREAGESEYRLYEIVTRVPGAHREPVRMLDAPRNLPSVDLQGSPIRTRLAALTPDVLALRRQWSEKERKQGTSVPDLRLLL